LQSSLLLDEPIHVDHANHEATTTTRGILCDSAHQPQNTLRILTRKQKSHVPFWGATKCGKRAFAAAPRGKENCSGSARTSRHNP